MKDLGEGQEDDLNFALILVIRPLELGPLDRALGKEGDEPHSLRRVSKIRSKVGKTKKPDCEVGGRRGDAVRVRLGCRGELVLTEA